MANNLVVTLLLKTGAFSTDLKKARGQVQNFQKGCDTAGKSVSAFSKALGVDIGMLTKFGGAVGIAVAAGKGLKAVIDSNQTSADAFQAAMYGAKSAVGELAYAIGTFDFSNFQDGLTGLINRARDAAKAIDQLGDTLRSYSLKEAKARAAIANARKVMRDKNATQEEKDAAKQRARDAVEEARAGAEMAVDDYVDTMVTTLREKAVQISREGALNYMDEALELNAEKGRDAAKAKAEADWNAYQERLGELQRNYTTTVTNQSIVGVTTSSKLDTDDEDYKRELAALNKEYEKSIVFHTVLVKQSEEEVTNLTNMRLATYNMAETLDNMDSRLEGIENKTNNVTGATQKGTEAIKESLTYWQNMAQEAQKTRDATVYMSDAWKEANNQLEEALDNIELITAAMERAKTNAKFGDALEDILTPITGPKLEGQVENTKPDKLAEDLKNKTIEELEQSLEVYQKKQKETFDPELLAHYNIMIKAIREQIERMNNYGVKTPTPDKEAKDKWDNFNDAMENTSTIVSNLAETFQEGTEVTAASILRMVSTSLPAISSLIAAIAALAGVEATEKAVESSKHWIEAIAAVAALGATVAAAISSAKNQRFANGGIVGGNSYTGDRMTASVNSGEMILNRAQQARLFKLANGATPGGSQVEFHISGTELVGVLNNQNRKNRLVQ